MIATCKKPFVSANASGPIHLQITLTRSKLEQLTEGLVQRTREPVDKALGDAKLKAADIDEVVAHVEKLGIDTSQRTSSARVSTLMIADPDGNHIAFAEAFDKTMAR